MKKEIPNCVYIVVSARWGWCPKSRSNGFFVSKAQALRACDKWSRVLKFTLANPEIIFTGQEVHEPKNNPAP